MAWRTSKSRRSSTTPSHLKQAIGHAKDAEKYLDLARKAMVDSASASYAPVYAHIAAVHAKLAIFYQTAAGGSQSLASGRGYNTDQAEDWSGVGDGLAGSHLD